jgi:hypothetical protein
MLYAGFPLTDAHVGRSFAVTSAHDPGSVEWAAFRGVDTLVLLMSGRSLPQIVDGLLTNGWAPDTPVCSHHSSHSQPSFHSPGGTNRCIRCESFRSVVHITHCLGRQWAKTVGESHTSIKLRGVEQQQVLFWNRMWVALHSLSVTEEL